ncbi:MAG: hypothetical protein LC663_02595 [Actinobacteria bacterium]|nr:hypothetical protein [Actinomycetota bacterium]
MASSIIDSSQVEAALRLVSSRTRKHPGMSVQPIADVPRWVVWGEGDPMPIGFFDEEVPDESAFHVIESVDPEWRHEGNRWAVVVTATEGELRGWADASGSVHGFAPYEAGPDAEHRKLDGPHPY